MELKLQNILFPDKDRYCNYDKLFFKSVQAVYDEENHCLAVARYNTCSFMTYLNAFSLKKWKQYTRAKRFFLRLEIQGDFVIQMKGYHLIQDSAHEKTYSSERVVCKERTVIQIEVPDMKETLVTFEINTKSDCFIYSGGYYTDVDAGEQNEVVLSIATVTFQKEEFITKNLCMIREELLSDETIGPYLYVHVIDNGRTLSREEIESEHIFYHPNKNVGGSGGFTRGMMEALRQNPKATNVLLMDDDVEILSESIRRTYMLLLLQKEEYQEYFISGAMLRFENMDEFHEDVGYVTQDGYQLTLKGKRTLNKKERILYNEEFDTNQPNTYAGWWYCCIPAKVIERSGYALPIFIRVDDTEYSLRNHAKFITMNGICVWHMGFVTKFSYFMEYYQVFRNFLIATACNGNIAMQDKVMRHFVGHFLSEMLRYNYRAAEFFVDAVRDFLKGPCFIEEEKCQERLTAMNARNAVLKDIEEVTEQAVDMTKVYEMDDRKLIDSIFYRLTFNGQLFWSRRKLKKEPAVIAFDWFYNPQRHAFRETLISVNPYTKEGEIRVQNRKQFRKIMKEAIIVYGKYRRKRERVNREYFEKRKYLVSDKFWEKYLELDEYQ